MAQKKITDLTLRSSFDATCNIAIDDSSQTWRATGQQIRDFITSTKTWNTEIENLTLTSSVGSSALTIAVKTKSGSDASSTDPVNVGMRSSTLTSGIYNLRQITGALSLVISSGSTLGQTSAKPSKIYIYLIDNAGTLELAVSHTLYREDGVVSTTAEGGAGGATSGSVMYSTSARSSVPFRLIGYILNTQTTAGTWASAGTQIQLLSASTALPAFVGSQGLVTTFTADGTFTTPSTSSPDTIYEYEMVAGGAGGGGANGSNAAAGGGGSGAYARGTFNGISPSTGISITVGGGGLRALQLAEMVEMAAILFLVLLFQLHVLRD